MTDKASAKERLDVLLVERGFFDSREKAKAAIMAGLVWLGTERLDKAGLKVARDAELTVKGAAHPYVSRGGLKLEKAIRSFGLDLRGAVMLDIGASTGGFTDCALQHGAAYVYAVDVGYNQLDWSLRRDERVCVLERTNFRYFTADMLKGPAPGIATIDVSFISLKLILPPLVGVLSPGGQAIALIKPQFEAGREEVGKSGVVRDARIHIAVLQDILAYADSCGFSLQHLTYSPITGGEGNIEFLACWTFTAQPHDAAQSQHHRTSLIEEVVAQAHAAFHATS